MQWMRFQPPRGAARLFPARAVEYVGLFGVLLFAFCWSLGPAGPSIGLGLFSLAFIVRLPGLRALLREPVVVWVLCLAAYLVLRTALALSRQQFDQEQILDGFKDWLWLLLFVPFAYWLAGDRLRLYRVLALGLAGFLCGMLASVDWGQLASFLDSRSGFHMRMVSFSLYSGTALLAMLVLAPRLWGGGTRPARLARMLLWFLVVALLTQGFIQTQSRGAWLAFGIVAPVLLLVRYWRALTASGYARLSWMALAGTLLLGAMLWFNSDLIEHRLGAERDTVAAIVRDGLDSAPKTSISYRLNLWHFAIDKWAQRPLSGWGPGSTKALIAGSGQDSLYFDDSGTYLDHLHNTALEILLQLGVLGAILWLGLLVALVRGLLQAARSGALPRDMLLWYLGFLALMGIWSLFDFRQMHYDWRYFWILVVGSGYSYCLTAAGIRSRPGAQDSLP